MVCNSLRLEKHPTNLVAVTELYLLRLNLKRKFQFPSFHDTAPCRSLRLCHSKIQCNEPSSKLQIHRVEQHMTHFFFSLNHLFFSRARPGFPCRALGDAVSLLADLQHITTLSLGISASETSSCCLKFLLA